MQILQQLIAAGFNRGHGNAPGMDRTVSSLDWAFTNLGNSGTARCYAADAASSLEARLIASYVIQSIAFLKSGDTGSALREYKKARGLQEMSIHDGSCGCALSTQVEAVLSELEGMFEQKKAAVAA